MPIKGNKSIRDQIPKGEHLTFVDTVKAAFMPAAELDEAGRLHNPRETYLTEQAKRRADEAKKRGS